MLVLIGALGAGSTGLACGVLLFGDSTDADDGGAPAASEASAGDADTSSTVQVAPPSDAADERSDDAGRACAPGFVQCNGLCVTGTDCTACDRAPLFCEQTGVCASTCAACAGSPIECFACNGSQANPIGTCEAVDAGGFCLSGDYANAYPGGGEHCDCSDTDVANCVGAQHVCLPHGNTDWCVTCGEQGQATNGLPCKGGGLCNATASPPRCE